MTATFKELNKPTKFTVTHRKDKYFCRQFTALAINKDGRMYEAVTCRIYATDSRSYCCIWTSSNCSWDNTKDYWRNGSGFASGYGYHRGSQAVENAIYNAGIELSEDIGGRGYEAVKEAIESIAKAMWDDSVKIFVTESHA